MPCLTIQATAADNLTGRVNNLPGPALTGGAFFRGLGDDAGLFRDDDIL